MYDMPKPRLPYVLYERTRHGRMVWYFRRGKGKRTRLKGTYGSDEFMACYNACLSGETPVYDRRKAQNGTLEWLIKQWQQSSDWSEKAQATRRQRENILLHVMRTSGRGDFKHITTADILRGKEKRKATRFAANNFLKTMRALFNWAVENGHMTVNPAASVKMFPKETPGFAPWTYDDVELYRDKWPIGTRERLAMELILSTGLRRGDAVNLGRQHIRNGIAKIIVEKTGVDLYVVIDADLQAIIDDSPCGDLTFISGKRGLPMKKEAFGTWFRLACRAAEITKSAHGLRKLAATTLAEQGGTETELQAKFGWQSGRQSQTYTRSANQKALAIQAAKKVRK